jgi:hypothetical protein
MSVPYRVLDKISKASTYVFVFCLLFIAQKYLFGLFFDLKEFVLFNKLYVYELIFSITSILLVKRFIIVRSPYEKYLKD